MLGCSAAALVAVAGIYSNTYDAALNVKNGFPVFSTVIEAVSVSKHEDQFEASKLTQEDRDAILALARDPRIGAPLLELPRNLPLVLSRSFLLLRNEKKDPVCLLTTISLSESQR